MGVVRWFRTHNRSTRAENLLRETRAEYARWVTGMDVESGLWGSHGYAEIRDPLHHGEGPP